MKWDQLEHGLLELNGNQVPELRLYFESRECASDGLRIMVGGNALSRLHALDRVVIWNPSLCTLRSRDVMNAPTHHTVDDFTIPLDTSQRVKWLLQSRPGGREAYLDRLLEAARGRAQADGTKDEARTEISDAEGTSMKLPGEAVAETATEVGVKMTATRAARAAKEARAMTAMKEVEATRAEMAAGKGTS